MSETEHNRGKLIPVAMEVDIETTAKKLFEGQELDEWSNTWTEQLEDSELFHIHDGQIYHVENKQTPDYEDIYLATKNEDGSIDYETKYYNGGCGFGEALDYAIENIGSEE